MHIVTHRHQYTSIMISCNPSSSSTAGRTDLRRSRTQRRSIQMTTSWTWSTPTTRCWFKRAATMQNTRMGTKNAQLKAISRATLLSCQLAKDQTCSNTSSSHNTCARHLTSSTCSIKHCVNAASIRSSSRTSSTTQRSSFLSRFHTVSCPLRQIAPFWMNA